MPRFMSQVFRGVMVGTFLAISFIYLHTNLSSRNFVGFRKGMINLYESEDTLALFENSKTTALRQCTMAERNAHAWDTCARRHDNSNRGFLLDPSLSRSVRHQYIANMFSNDEHKLLVCFNSKAGSSTFKTIMTRYSKHFNPNRTGYKSWDVVHAPDYLKEHGISRLSLLSDADILHRLKTYTRVTFVRHPLVRVYSAYKQKLATVKPPACGHYQQLMGIRILKTLRNNLTEEEQQCGNTVTFPEFIEYLVGEGRSDALNDPHFQTYDHQCKPCFVDYDFIVKLESGDQDQEAFIKRFMNPNAGADKNFRVNEGKDKDYSADSYNTIIKQYSQINAAHMRLLLDIYRTDMELYGYTYKIINEGLEAKCQMPSDQEQCC